MSLHRETEHLVQEDFAARATLQRLNWVGRAGTVFLLVLGAIFLANLLVLGGMLRFLAGGDIRQVFATAVMVVFLSGALLSLSFFFLCGAGLLDLSEGFLRWLGGVTLAQVAAMATTIVAYFFKR